MASEIAKLNGYSNLSYLDTTSRTTSFLGRSVINTMPDDYKGTFFTAIGHNYAREQITQRFRLKNPQSQLVSLIHPSAVVSEEAVIEEGVIIMPLSVICCFATIEEGVIINTRSSADHDVVMRRFSSLAPGVSLGGYVEIGERSAISIGSSLIHDIKIGNDVLVGAGSTVLSEVTDNSVTYGTPARHIRYRKPSDSYF